MGHPGFLGWVEEGGSGFARYPTLSDGFAIVRGWGTRQRFFLAGVLRGALDVVGTDFLAGTGFLAADFPGAGLGCGFCGGLDGLGCGLVGVLMAALAGIDFFAAALNGGGF